MKYTKFFKFIVLIFVTLNIICLSSCSQSINAENRNIEQDVAPLHIKDTLDGFEETIINTESNETVIENIQVFNAGAYHYNIDVGETGNPESYDGWLQAAYIGEKDLYWRWTLYNPWQNSVFIEDYTFYDEFYMISFTTIYYDRPFDESIEEERYIIQDGNVYKYTSIGNQLIPLSFEESERIQVRRVRRYFDLENARMQEINGGTHAGG